MTIKVGMPEDDQEKILDLIAPQGELFREVVLDAISLIHHRIHVEGLAADGTQIGTYSDSYMAVRTGNYSNTPKVTRGANKGKPRRGEAGTFTRGDKAGSARPRYNFGPDTKVILVLTGAMERDYVVAPGETGWGIGFLNSHNFDKAEWNNDRYGHIIYDFTDEELEHVIAKTEKLITEQSNAIH